MLLRHIAKPSFLRMFSVLTLQVMTGMPSAAGEIYTVYICSVAVWPDIPQANDQDELAHSYLP